MHRKGFLLSEALMAVLITAMLSLVVYGAVTLHTSGIKEIQQKRQQMAEHFEDALGQMKGCEETCQAMASP
ncbi:MAG: hypothetical protein SOI44_02725 [Lactimicrobium sp.]|uniref:hypothetical protein n=2 Tax=Lactimicrobium sp. TaxID=2563780 RepID=UPI002F360977